MELKPYIETSAPKNRRGIALMLVMIAILVTGGMAVAYFGSRDNSIAISTNVASSSQARIVAESGLDLAIAILETNADWRTNHIDGVILQDYQVNGGTISVTIIDSDTSLPPTESTFNVEITVASTVGGRTQLTEATATIIPNEDEFDVDYSEFAIFANNHISMFGASTVRNWGASPMASQEPIQIGTLATSPMAVQLNSINQNSSVELSAPEHASSMVSSSSMNTSPFTDSLPYLAPPPPPSESQQLTLNNHQFETNTGRWANQFISGFSNLHNWHAQPTTVSSGSYSLDELHLTSDKPILIHGDVIVTVQNDFTMHFGSITLAEDSTLTLHVNGEVNIRSSYIGNENHSTQSWMDASRVQLYGQNDEDWDISGISTVKAELYAPSSDIDVSGISTICGRIAGDNVTLRGASTVLYDQSLDNGGFADSDGLLYDDNGFLLSEVQQLTQLEPSILDSVERSLTDYHDSSGESYIGQHVSSDWRNEPTDRPHEVIYMLVVYGVDTRQWEQRVRQMRNTDTTMYSWLDNR